MPFQKYNEDGSLQRFNQAVIDCSNDPIITEQSHKDEVNINNIVKRHGIDMIQKTALLQTNEYHMDDIPTNDFQESMLIITKAQQTFEQLPSVIRKKFDNNPAKYMDFIHNKDNIDEMIEMGLAQRQPIDQPVEVIVTNPETPQE